MHHLTLLYHNISLGEQRLQSSGDCMSAFSPNHTSVARSSQLRTSAHSFLVNFSFSFLLTQLYQTPRTWSKHSHCEDDCGRGGLHLHWLFLPLMWSGEEGIINYHEKRETSTLRSCWEQKCTLHNSIFLVS